MDGCQPTIGNIFAWELTEQAAGSEDDSENLAPSEWQEVLYSVRVADPFIINRCTYVHSYMTYMKLHMYIHTDMWYAYTSSNKERVDEREKIEKREARELRINSEGNIYTYYSFLLNLLEKYDRWKTRGERRMADKVVEGKVVSSCCCCFYDDFEKKVDQADKRSNILHVFNTEKVYIIHNTWNVNKKAKLWI